MEQEAFTFRVIDLKQYVYCPRILYYQTVLPEIRPLTYKMEAGIQAHVQAEGREKRRSLRTYGLQTGERFFNVPLVSPELGLSGLVDMVIETEMERIPVDYKQAKKITPHVKLQLMAYGRLLETQQTSPAKVVRRGFIYLLPMRQAVEIAFTPALRRQFAQALQELADIAAAQRMPLPTPHNGRCPDCEFRRFCNDVV